MQTAHTAGPVPRATAQIDVIQLTPLTGNTPRLARPEYDQGALSGSTQANHILLLLKPSVA